MASFHDVMKTFRWEMRCLSFFLAVAEANAFSAYVKYAHDGSKTMHEDFRCRLAQSLISHVEQMRMGTEASIHVLRARVGHVHRRMSLGKPPGGGFRRRRCKVCGNKTPLVCSCNPDGVFCNRHMENMLLRAISKLYDNILYSLLYHCTKAQSDGQILSVATASEKVGH